MQNFAVRIISGTRKFDHITPTVRDLRWLPIKQNLFFCDAVMVFKCMTGKAPVTLAINLRQELRSPDVRPEVINC